MMNDSIGIDISKDHLDVHRLAEETLASTNESPG